MMVGNGRNLKGICDGAGLCSWPAATAGEVNAELDEEAPPTAGILASARASAVLSKSLGSTDASEGAP